MIDQARLICEVIVESAILSSSANKNALLIMTDNPVSPSKGKKTFSILFF